VRLAPFSTAVMFTLVMACGATPPHPGAGEAPYGTWSSPITAEVAAAAQRELDEPAFDDAGNRYWLESLPDGRSTLMRRTRSGPTVDLTPDADVRSEAHAYGGGALLVDGTRVFYTDAGTHELRMRDGETTHVLARDPKAWHVDCASDRQRMRLVCVREDGTTEIPTDSLVAIEIGNGTTQPLAAGHDFFAEPRLSPDGRQLSYLTWELPRMPWTGTELWVASFTADGSLGAPTKIAGGATESIYQASWSPDGDLYFTSDRTGYWNLYRVHSGAVTAVWTGTAELGLPGWTLHRGMFAFASPTTIIAAAVDNGVGKLLAIDTTTGVAASIPTPFNVMRGGVRAHDGHALMLAGSPTEPLSVVDVEIATGKPEVLARAGDTTLAAALIAPAEPFTFSTAGGGVGYAYYYAPTNPAYRGSSRERPPLIVRAHGGPTGRVDPFFNADVYYWTSRGFAVTSVNYGGSTGHGRAYRERLSGQWGVIDVDDCFAAANALVTRGLADSKRLLIRGGSAGGYTTLAAVAFRDVFRAGASWFGIGDIARMDQVTRGSDKFESGYTQLLIGTDPALIRARSPLFSADRIKAPVIFFSGSEDPVVPAEQSQMMFEALKRRGVTTAHIEFPGEKHGFRKLENNARALRAELYFYQHVLGLALSEGTPPVTIENPR